MSELLRPARDDEVARVWPAVKAARLFTTIDELSAFRAGGPWRIRVSDSGEAMLVAPWRAHLDLLAIRGVWSATHRIPALVEDAVAVARAQGFSRVLSPLMPRSALAPYRVAGMTEVASIVALQGFSAELAAGRVPEGVRLRPAANSDFDALLEIDHACFDEFWRYGPFELADARSRERMTVAEDDAGVMLGYATCSLHGASATLGRLAVAPAARRRGVARALIADSALWASRADCFAFTLCTQEDNAASRALYASVGMLELAEPYALAQTSE